MDKFRRTIALALVAAVLTVIATAKCFAAPNPEDGDLDYLPDTSFAFPLGADVNVRWVIPPVSKVKPNARFDINNRGTPLIGYGEAEKYLMYPDKEYIVKVDAGFSDFAYLDNGVLLFANGNDINVLAKPKGALQTEKGIPIVGLQPVTSVPVRGCDAFGNFDNTVYCAGLNEKSGEYELYVIQPEKGAGLKELEKLFSSREAIGAVAGDDKYLFVAFGRRVVRIENATKAISPVYIHPSTGVKGLAYNPGAGLFISTGMDLIFSGPHGVIEIMRSPNHQITMRKGILYVFLPKSFALFALERLEDLRRFNLNVQPASSKKKSPVTITAVRFFESGPPPYTNKQYTDIFDRTAMRSMVSQIDYHTLSASTEKQQHAAVVSWYEPTGGLLAIKTYTFASQSGSIFADIGGEAGRGGYRKGKWRFGSDALGLRYPGKYRVTVQIDGIPAGEYFFALNGTATPFEALAYDDPETMKRLLAQGYNPNKKDDEGVPLLHQAVQYGTARLVELLLKAGANPNAVDKENSPALAIAIHRASDWLKKADLLISNGAKVDATFGERHLPLTHSMAITEPQLYYLIEQGASVHAVDPTTKTPVLARAAYRDVFCTDRLFSLLMKRGAKVDTLDDSRTTPLGYAVKYAHPECVRQLLDRGASTVGVSEDRNGKRSALFLALLGYVEDEKENRGADIMRRIRIIDMLREKGVVLGAQEGWVVAEGSVSSFFGSDEIYRNISDNDYALEKAAKSENAELRRLAARRYLEKAREVATLAGDRDELGEALKDCNTARRLSEAGEQKNLLPEVYLYCGLLEHKLGGMKQNAQADLRRYLELVPAAPNAGELKALSNP